MSEDNLANTDNTEPNIETTTDEPQGKSEVDWKAEARKWETRAKASRADSEDASKWREYETSQKSEHEKLAEELDAYKNKASQAEATLLRYEIAAEKGIAGDATRLLKGSSREELEAEAELLLSLIANQNKPKTPLPDENQGKPSPTALGQITDRNALKGMSPDEIMKAKADGRLDSLLGKS